MNVEILSKKRILDDFFKVEEVTLRHEQYNGQMSETMRRLNFERGDSVACLLWNKDKQCAIFTEQFRYPAHTKGNGWILEVIAGSCKSDEDPAEAMKRELLEEVGYEVENMRHLHTFFVSPGGTSERIILFYAEVCDDDQIAEGGGLLEEHEDIRTVSISFKELEQKFTQGEILDAKTLIAIQWFLANNKWKI